MPDLDYVRVVGRLGIVVRDETGDADDLPDTIWCDSGQVHFTPLVAAVKVAEADPVPVTLGRSTIIGEIDTEGYLSLRGIRSVVLEDLTSTKVNPQIGPGKATHRVDFVDLMADGQPVSLPTPVNVRFAADMADEWGNVDLTLVTPVPVAGGTAQIVGPRGMSAYQGWIAEGNTGTFDDFMAEYVEVEIPARLAEFSSTVADCDLVLSNGFYRIVQGDTVNGPTGTGYWALFVNNYGDGSVYQRAMQLIDSTETPQVYERHKYLEDWSDWRRIRQTQDELDALYLNIGEGIQDSMLPARLRASGRQIANWDTVLEPGWYFSYDSSAGANGPYVAHWSGRVDDAWDSDGWVQQTVWDITNGDDTTDIPIYRRRRFANTWGAWKRVYQTQTELDNRYLNHTEVVGDSNLPNRLKPDSQHVTDWNLVFDSGWYGDGLNTPNAPEANGYWLGHVVKSASWTYQTVWSLGGSTGGDTLMYRRRRNGSNGQWEAWYRVLSSTAELDGRYLNHNDVVANTNLPGRLREQTQDLSQSTNANLLLDRGKYCIFNTDGTALNTPGNGIWVIDVYTLTTAYLMQVAHGVVDFVTGYKQTWRRYKASSNWTAWERVYDGEAELDARYLNSDEVVGNGNLPLRLRAGAAENTITDLNAATDSGWYYFTNAATNTPFTWWGAVLVIRSGTEIHQLAFQHGAQTDNVSNRNRYGIWERWGVINTSWSSWKKIAHTMEELEERNDGRYSKLNDPNYFRSTEKQVFPNPNFIGVTQDGVLTTPGWLLSPGASKATDSNGIQHVALDMPNATTFVSVTASARQKVLQGEYLRVKFQYVQMAGTLVSPTVRISFFSQANTVENYDGVGHVFVDICNETNSAPPSALNTRQTVEGAVQVPEGFRFARIDVYVGERGNAGIRNYRIYHVGVEYSDILLTGRFGSAGQGWKWITDPDTVTDPGVYNWNSGGSSTRAQLVLGLAAAHADYGALLTVKAFNSSFLTQEAHVYADGRTWARHRNNGVWSDWVYQPKRKADMYRLAMATKGSSGRNLVYNGRFDYLTEYTQGPTQQKALSTHLARQVPGWHAAYANEAISGNFILGGNNTIGGQSLGLRSPNNSTGTYCWSDPFPVNPGKTYRWKFKVWSDEAIPQGIYMSFTTRTTMNPQNFNDGLTSDDALVNNVGHPGQQFVTYQGYHTIPNGNHTYGFLRPHAWIGANPSGSNTVYYTEIEFEEVIPTAALGDSGWINPQGTFQNGWSHLNVTNFPVGYRKIGNKVILRGLAANGTVDGGGTNGVIFTLPSGYRPAFQIHRAVASANAYGTCRVSNDGKVEATTGSNSWFSLDGIEFTID